MKLPRTLPFLFLTLVIGCAQTKPIQVNNQQNKEISQNNKPKDSSAKTPFTVDAADVALPKIELTSSILYSVLASEIASQRGLTIVAAQTYLNLAQTTKDPRLAERAAKLAISGGNAQLAQQASDLWLSLDAKSSNAIRQSLLLKLNAGKMLENQSQIESLLLSEPQPPKNIFNMLALTADLQKDKAASFVYIQKLTSRYPNLAEAQFALIAAASEDKQQDIVDKGFDQLFKLAPNWDLPVAWQVDHLHKIQLDDSLLFLKHELARRPKASYELKIAYPKLLVAADKYDEAQVAFISLLNEYPNNPELLYASGLVCHHNKDFDRSAEYLKKALDNGYKANGFIYYTLGSMANEKKQLKEAIGWYAKIKKSDKEYKFAQMRIALIEASDGGLNKAMQRINKLPIKSQKERIQISILQANIAREANQKDLSWSIISKAIHKFPNTPDLLYFRAALAEERGRFTQAESDMRSYLKVLPNDAVGLNALGYMLTVNTKRYAEAKVYIEKALQSDPKNGAVIDSMGWVLYKQGDAERALPYLQKAWMLMPNAEVAAHLGEVLFTLGKKDQANAVWLNGYRLDMKNKALLETMQRFGMSKP